MTHAAATPLGGVRVVAMEHSVAGPLASRILAELGAEVIKVERPGAGDFARSWDRNVSGESAQFWWLNCGKRSVAIDVKSTDGAAAFRRLLGHADVLVHNLSPLSAARLGLDGQRVHEEFPSLINCQISGYGSAGPAVNRKAYDMLIQAEAGVMGLTGTPERPTRVGVSIADVSTGLYAALLILAALYGRRQTGSGRHLDVSMFDVTVEFLGPMLLSFLNAGIVYERIPDQHHAIAPYGVFRCADGERVLLAVEHDGEWAPFCLHVLEMPELATDRRYLTNVDRVHRRDELATHIASCLATRSAADVVAALSSAGLAYARVHEVPDVANHEVLAYRRIVAPARTADGTPVRTLAGIAARLFQTATAAPRNRPPLLGEDNDLLLPDR